MAIVTQTSDSIPLDDYRAIQKGEAEIQIN